MPVCNMIALYIFYAYHSLHTKKPCDCSLVYLLFPLNLISSEKGVTICHPQFAGIHGLQADVVASVQILCRTTEHAAVA